MNTATFENVIVKNYAICLLLFFGLLLQSCSNEIPFLTSSVVPAAEGSVKVKKDRNNNYHIKLSVMRLAEPERLDPPKAVYVLWMETAQNRTKNIGQLITSKSFFSKVLKSSLETVASDQPTRFFITAEDAADIQDPVGQEVLSTASLVEINNFKNDLS